MSETTTMPTTPIVHPSWCDPAECGEDMTGGYLRDVYHRSAMATFTNGTDDGDYCRVQLLRSDNHDGTHDGDPSTLNVVMGVQGEVPVDQLDALGA